MIGRLIGTASSDLDGGVLLDVRGVGYELVTPIGTVGRAQTDKAGATTIHVHTHVTEHSMELFGFASPAERSTFRTLIGISKVGPKLALAVLSVLTVDDLADIIGREDAVRLTRVPGVGKKTAERMILELRGKLAPAGTTAGTVAAPAPIGERGVVVDALVRMGFRQDKAQRAVAALPDDDQPVGDLLRMALKQLAP